MGFNARYHGLQCSFSWVTMLVVMGDNARYHGLHCSLSWVTMLVIMGYNARYHGLQCSLSWVTMLVIMGYNARYREFIRSKNLALNNLSRNCTEVVMNENKVIPENLFAVH